MNRKLLIATIALPVLWAAGQSCSNESDTPPKVTTGTTATTGGGGDSSSTTSSVTSTGNGGSAATTTSTGNGGSGGDATTTTGTAGSGGSGMGGSGMGGSAGGTGGMGGAGGAGGGKAGASGSGGAGGGTDTIDSVACIKNSFGECFKDSWFMFGCYSQAGQDCITNRPGTACPNQDRALPMENQGLTTDEDFTLGGTVGKMYKLTIKVNGITEGKIYEQGTRAAGNQAPPNVDDPNGIDGWYTGGRPVDFENYNVYKIAIHQPPTTPNMPTSGAEVAHYYLNSMPPQSSAGTNYENHNTFPFGYTKDIVVPGGGVIHYHTADRNCHAIDNCGAGSRSTSCAVTAGRNIPNEPNVMIPANFMGQPVSGINTRNSNAQPFHAQILHITVTALTPM